MDNFQTAYVPVFNRIADHIGLWCLEPIFASQLWEFVRTPEQLRAHMLVEPEEPKCAVDMISTPNGAIADIKISGLMMKGQSSFGGTSTILARREIRKAASDPDTAGIMLSIDSPGGSVSGTSELGADIKAASSAKPVWSYIEDTGASAAFWAASQTQKIFANTPHAMVGSIGTYQVLYDQSAAAEKEGVKTLLFATGSLKGLGTPGTKITDEQISHVQGLIDNAQLSFDAAVKSGRNMTDEQLKRVRHGGVVSAKDAIAAKLIDGIAPKEKVMGDFVRHLKSPRQFMQNAEVNEVLAKGGLPMMRSSLPTIKGSQGI